MVKIVLLGGQDTRHVLFALQDIIGLYHQPCEVVLYEKTQGMHALYAAVGAIFAKREGDLARVRVSHDLHDALTGASLILLLDVSDLRGQYLRDCTLMKEQGMENQCRTLAGVGGMALCVRLWRICAQYGERIQALCPAARVMVVLPQADKMTRLLRERFGLEAYGYDLSAVVGDVGYGAIARVLDKSPECFKVTQYGFPGLSFLSSVLWTRPGEQEGLELLPLLRKRVSEGALGLLARRLLDDTGAVMVGDTAQAAQYLASQPGLPLSSPCAFALSEEEQLEIGQMLSLYPQSRDVGFDTLLRFGLPQHAALFGLSLMKEMPPLRAPALCVVNGGVIPDLANDTVLQMPLLSLGGASVRPACWEPPCELLPLLLEFQEQQRLMVAAAAGDFSAMRDFCEGDQSLEGLDRLYCLDALQALLEGDDICS